MDKIIKIDLGKWQTQKDAASKYKGKGCSQEYICKLITLRKIDVKEIPELGLRLVSRDFNDE